MGRGRAHAKELKDLLKCSLTAFQEGENSRSCQESLKVSSLCPKKLCNKREILHCDVSKTGETGKS